MVRTNKNAHEAIAENVTDVLCTFDIIYDLLLNRSKATRNLYDLYNKETETNVKTSVFQLIVSKNQSKCEKNLTYYTIDSRGLTFKVQLVNVIINESLSQQR